MAQHSAAYPAYSQYDAVQPEVYSETTTDQADAMPFTRNDIVWVIRRCLAARESCPNHSRLQLLPRNRLRLVLWWASHGGQPIGRPNGQIGKAAKALALQPRNILRDLQALARHPVYGPAMGYIPSSRSKPQSPSRTRTQANIN